MIAWTIFTSGKRSLGQSNVFTHVCQVSHSVHRGGGLPSLAGVSSIAAPHPPPMAKDGTPLPRMAPPRSKNGRYAPYWNAALWNYEVTFSEYLRIDNSVEHFPEISAGYRRILFCWCSKQRAFLGRCCTEGRFITQLLPLSVKYG